MKLKKGYTIEARSYGFGLYRYNTKVGGYRTELEAVVASHLDAAERDVEKFAALKIVTDFMSREDFQLSDYGTHTSATTDIVWAITDKVGLTGQPEAVWSEMFDIVSDIRREAPKAFEVEDLDLGLPAHSIDCKAIAKAMGDRWVVLDIKAVSVERAEVIVIVGATNDSAVRVEYLGRQTGDREATFVRT